MSTGKVQVERPKVREKERQTDRHGEESVTVPIPDNTEFPIPIHVLP